MSGYPARLCRHVRYAIAIVGLVAVSVGLLTPMPSAHAYSLENVYPAQWAAIRLYQAGFASSTEQSGFTSAMTAWTNSGAPVSFGSWGSSSGAEILEDNSSYGATGWDGQTAISYTSSHCNGWTQTLYSQIHINHSYTGGYSAAAVQSVSAHELGHALGLAHSSGAVLMNPNTYGSNSRWETYSINTPQSDDVNGVKAIYNKCP